MVVVLFPAIRYDIICTLCQRDIICGDSFTEEVPASSGGRRG